MAEILKLVTVEEAFRAFLPQVNKDLQGTEVVDLSVALNRVLAEDIVSGVDVPGFHRSTVDGIAVMARDTFGASESLPALVDIAGEVFMGQDAGIQLAPGIGVKIPTGGMLPVNADAVVMIEYVEAFDDRTVGINRPVAPGENMVRAGEDVAVGQHVLNRGHRLRPQDIGALAGIGITEVKVFEVVRVGIISTGDEVVDPAKEPGPGQVRDINSYALAAQVEEIGGQVTRYGIIPDTFEDLYQVTARALQENHLVVLSGGSSVGTRDNSAKVINELGSPGVVVHGVSIRPGKPTILGIVNGQPLFGLPGHPASAMVIFDIFVKPVIQALQGLSPDSRQPVIRARLSRNMASGSGREDHVRVALVERDGELWAEPILGKSGLITTMVQANGVFRIPLHKEGVQAGEIVEVRIF
ncbi:MAG: molybdopterin-binding protein [Clostridia bacterium]|nr:molybdopterin-binding protein [Clostridia bacterium]